MLTLHLYLGLGSGGTVPIPTFFSNPTPIPPEPGSKSRLVTGSGRVTMLKPGSGPWNPEELFYWFSSLDELYSQKVLTASKIPKKCFAGIGIGIGTGFCRVRDGRDRDEKTTVPPDPILDSLYSKYFRSPGSTWSTELREYMISPCLSRLSLIHSNIPVLSMVLQYFRPYTITLVILQYSHRYFSTT